MKVSRRMQAGRGRTRGYLIVMFVVIVAFVGVLASMQVLVLTSVATTSRAYDAYRQGATELVRLERVVTETLLDLRQVSAAGTSNKQLADALDFHLHELAGVGAAVTVTSAPSSLPAVVLFPDSTAAEGPLGPVASDLQPFLTPELSALMGPHVWSSEPIAFELASERIVLDVKRTYRIHVEARLISVPLTRYATVAYDLPAEIGKTDAAPPTGPASLLPSGLVPSRDPAFVDVLQAQRGILPYCYRHRAIVAAAYQYIFSQAYIDRVAEYAGITHYRDIDALGGTALLAGLSVIGANTDWDLGAAGDGTFGTITLNKNAAVIFTEQPGKTVRLHDSIGATNAPALLVLLLGPSDPSVGPLTVDVESIARPTVIIGYNVRVAAAAGVTLNGALFLDQASTIAAAGPITAGHLSYWAGATTISGQAVLAGPMPAAAEEIAPRAVFVATNANRL